MTLLLAFAATLMIAVLISALAERTVLSTTVLFLAAGILLGRGVLGGLPALNPNVLATISELALFSVLFTDGMRAGGEPAPPGAWGLLVRALGIAMPLTIGAIALLARWLVGLPWMESFLLGAVLSPTDPVFVSAIFAFDAVPARLRHLLNLESGLNDGLALPVVIVLLAEIATKPVPIWLVLAQLAAGVAIGVFIPWVGIRLEASRFFGASGQFRPLNAFALGLLVLALALRLDVNIFLAAFAGGVSVARFSPAVRQAFDRFGSLIAELLKLAAILIFGLEMAPGLFNSLGWLGVLFVVLALFGARMAAMAISLAGSGLSRSEILAMGWFGPKGFASVVYGLMILGLGTPQAQRMAHLVGITIVLSIVVYSSTDILVARWFESQGRLRQPVPDAPDQA